jgi:hypothetical protein
MPRHPIRKRVRGEIPTTVYHVGSRPVPGGRVSRGFSQEGGELSVSEHPDEWSAIARLGGDVWQLRKFGARFFRVPGNRSPRATAWASQRGYLAPATVWRLWCGRDESGEETYFDFFSREEAVAESADYDPDDADGGEKHPPGEIEEVAGYRFGPLGEAYWRQNFDKPINHTWAESFAPIFYARAHGYDGVWYNERYDPANLSCPRGLILQERLPDWVCERYSPLRD